MTTLAVLRSYFFDSYLELLLISIFPFLTESMLFILAFWGVYTDFLAVSISSCCPHHAAISLINSSGNGLL